MHFIIPLLLMAFKIWMVVDAIQRRAGYIWLMVIFFLPFGEFVYFFMVRYRLGPANRAGKVGNMIPAHQQQKVVPNLAALRFSYEETPSILNQVALAQGLHDLDQFEEAGELFEDVLRRRPKERACLFGLAHCQSGLGRPEAAVEMLQKLVDRDPAYLDFAPFSDLADAQRACGRDDDALTSLRELCRVSPRIDHKLALTEQLVRMEQKEEAREVLQHALEAHAMAPAHVKKAGRGSAARAQELLQALA